MLLFMVLDSAEKLIENKKRRVTMDFIFLFLEKFSDLMIFNVG